MWIWARDVDLGQNNHRRMIAKAHGQASVEHDSILFIKVSTLKGLPWWSSG